MRDGSRDARALSQSSGTAVMSPQQRDEPALVEDRGKGTTMPQKKHLRGVSDKEQRQYEHIKESAEKSGRYGERAKEVAARTVMKEHKEKGHKTGN
ncbi:MAG TPA: hypothetical protein VGQ73_04485 [Gemmatimonadales bacterium]|jgi:hypothetical protein|nr:hypothetical protein [Gemmatimonadales bacterium]